MIITWNIAYIYERSRNAWEIRPIQNSQVKGQNYILSSLRVIYPFIENLTNTYPSMFTTRDSMRDWISYLEKKYAEPNIGGMINLDYNDAQKMSTDSLKWHESLLHAYSERGTILINEQNFQKVFPVELLSKLDEDIKNDLMDGYLAIIHLLPTPAAMILFRLAENIVRKYYVKITGKPAGKQKWFDLLDELEKSPDVNKSFVGYMHYIRDERNKAEHPEKRFEQEESEKILLRIKDLLVELKIV